MECLECHRRIVKKRGRGRPRRAYCSDKCGQAYRQRSITAGRTTLQRKAQPKKPRAKRTTPRERLEAEAAASGIPETFPAGAIARCKGRALVTPSAVMLGRIARELGVCVDREAERKRMAALEQDLDDEKIDLIISPKRYERMLVDTRRLLGI